jgi:hypothetical protein
MGSWEVKPIMVRELNRLPNMRIKLTACGTRSHGKNRRLSHAAAYPRRYTDKWVK